MEPEQTPTSFDEFQPSRSTRQAQHVIVSPGAASPSDAIEAALEIAIARRGRLLREQTLLEVLVKVVKPAEMDKQTTARLVWTPGLDMSTIPDGIFASEK